jgi:pimeloyl-ACP methyl ester carboxylesterase
MSFLIRMAACSAALAILLPGAALARPAGAPVPTLAWERCGGGLDCATASVPLDHDQPRGPRLSLALARRPATDPAHRIGTLFLNPGGPGGSGVEFLRARGPALATLNRRFDLVGFDPRGVGANRPAIDCVSDGALDQLLASAPNATPFNAGAFLARGDRVAAGCRALTPAPLLAHVSTADVARDLDLLRRAVGDQRLSYLGFSYGTELGAEYATLFPGRVRALALDGAVDHELWWRDPLGGDRSAARGYERAIQRFFAFCAGDQRACPFGGQDPEAAFDALLGRLDAKPIAGLPGDARLVDDHTARSAAAAAMYSESLWPVLGQGLAAAAAGNGAVLQQLADSATGRRPDGSFGNLLEATSVVHAGDARTPRADWPYRLNQAALLRISPHFGPLLAEVSALRRGMPQGADALDRPVHNPAYAATALVVGTTGDNAAPYEEAVALTRQLANARLLTRVGNGHTAYFTSACIRAAVDAYLVDGTLPASGTSCPTD